MKTLKFSRNSWHYQLAEFPDRIVSNNLCSYFWQVLLGICLSLLFAALIAIFVGLPIVTLLIILFNGFDFDLLVSTDINWLGFGLLLIFVYLIIFIFASIDIGIKKLKEKIRQKQYNKKFHSDYQQKDSFISTTYTMIKDKICFKIEFR